MKNKNNGTKCTQKTNSQREVFRFKAKGKRIYNIDFSGGDITSNGGAIFLRQADNNIGLSKKISAAIEDPRNPKRCKHSLINMVKQRLYSIALGYEDLNDHQNLRKDKALQHLIGHDSELASPDFS